MRLDDARIERTSAAVPAIVMVVDDHNAMRRMTRRLVLESYPHSEILEARDGEAALAGLSRRQPRLVLMDIHLPGMDGLEATRRILAQVPDTTIIAMSLSDDWRYHRLATEAGAIAFVSKAHLGERLPEILAELSGAHP